MFDKIQTHYNGHYKTDLVKALKDTGAVMPLVQAGNTFPAVPNWLEPEAVSNIQSCFAPLRAFGTVFDSTPYAPNAKRIVKLVQTASDTIVDGTNFQVGGSNVDGLEVTVNHYSQPWTVSNKDLNSGIRERDLLLKNAEELSNTLSEALGFWLSTAVFTATPVTVAGAAFGLGDAASLYGRIPGNRKALVLHPTNFGMMAGQSPTGFLSGAAVHGWKNGIHELSAGWSGKVRGIGCTPEALVIVTGLLVESPYGNVQRRLIGLPGLDIVLEWSRWFSTTDRQMWNSLDVVAGFTVGLPGDGVLIVEP